MTWRGIGFNLLIVAACYAMIHVLSIVWNLIFAPARLKREAKHKAGLESLNQVLSENSNMAVKGLEKLIDKDEE